jgi:hypothetical protein
MLLRGIQQISVRVLLVGQTLGPFSQLLGRCPRDPVKTIQNVSQLGNFAASKLESESGRFA